jgi:hypothetical protein
VLPWRTPDAIAIGLWLAAYTLLIAACALNLRRPGVPLVAAGMISNVVAILANGGHMPALPSALRAAGMHYEASRNSVAMATPHLATLVDRWAAPSWVPLANVFSVGDVAIAAGGFAFAFVASGGWAALTTALAAVTTIRRNEPGAE